MEVKAGDTIVLDNKTAKVETSWGAGAHRMFRLDDGREIVDLHKLIHSGRASWIPGESPAPKKPIKPLDLSPMDED